MTKKRCIYASDQQAAGVTGAAVERPNRLSSPKCAVQRYYFLSSFLPRQRYLYAAFPYLRSPRYLRLWLSLFFFFSRAFLLRSEICDNNERTSAREMQVSHSTRTHSWLDSADGFDMVDRNWKFSHRCSKSI